MLLIDALYECVCDWVIVKLYCKLSRKSGESQVKSPLLVRFLVCTYSTLRNRYHPHCVIIVAENNAIKYFNAVNATLFTSGVRYPLTQNPPRANVASPLHRRHGASSLICNFIKVNTNMSHFLFLTLTLQQAPRLLHSPSSFTTDPNKKK